MSTKSLTTVTGTGSTWKLSTPFGNITRKECGGYRHGIVLAKTRLAEFKAKGRKSSPVSHFISDNILWTFQGRFERNRPLYYAFRGI